MTSNLEPNRDRPDASKIVGDGAYYIVERCAGFDEFYPIVKQAFHDGVRQLAGEEAAAGVARDGLGKLHLHFPTEKVLMLENYVETTLRHTLYKWSWRVGRDDLKLSDPFYIDHLIVIRIHFPFEVARTARHAEKPARSMSDIADHAVSAIRNPKILLNQASRAIRRPRAKSAYAPETFHGDLVKPARSHGAHIDTWYGHSFDGINMWWSIEGVNALNSVIVYPDMAGRPVPYDPRSMYLAAGTHVSRPLTVDLKPGELFLFNPEVLHSTHVNVSDETRVALTTRVNPNAPKFNSEAPFNFEHWHLSSDIARDRYSAMQVYPASENPGQSAIKPRATYVNERTIQHFIGGELDREWVDVAPSDIIQHGTKVAVDFDNAKLVLWRREDGTLRAWSRLCPHVGVDLVDGWHDTHELHCPGHGVAFNLEAGTSACKSFNLMQFQIREANGRIFVAAGKPATVTSRTDAQTDLPVGE
jgi:nitrite reductase/ring-hydroxylating ferredoxin subunit